MKNFVKGIDQNGAGFAYLKETFPRISDAKIKEGIFVSPPNKVVDAGCKI
jgi:hypothetical protein